jgi:hypothetical protein
MVGRTGTADTLVPFLARVRYRTVSRTASRTDSATAKRQDHVSQRYFMRIHYILLLCILLYTRTM